MKLYDRKYCRRYVRSLISLYRLRFVKFTLPHNTIIVDISIIRNFSWALLCTLGRMSLMLFIWCFDLLLAPYPMNSFFSLFLKLSELLIPLSGNLSRNEARGLVISGAIAPFSPILLAFVWTQSKDAPVILGHMIFFAEFNVCFYRHELAFEICPRKKLGDGD